MSYRGSDSQKASKYKLDGHKDEEIFAKLINGEVIKGTGKTDVIDRDSNKYSLKSGAKKWQIFLYGINRFQSNSFSEINDIRLLFLESLNSFPKNYETYLTDKNEAKKIIIKPENRLIFSNKNEKDIIEKIGQNNSYLSSKLKLQKNFKKIKKELEIKSNIHKFLDISIFNNGEVNKLAIKDGNKFNIFDRKDVLNCLSNELVPNNSTSGNRRDDLNIGGQKVLLKSRTNENVVEIEVRNDSPKHYRQIRFNMLREKANDILFKMINKKVISY